MTNTIYDITHESDAIMLVGSNPEHAHPVLGMQVRQAVQRGAKLIVVDPVSYTHLSSGHRPSVCRTSVYKEIMRGIKD